MKNKILNIIKKLNYFEVFIVAFIIICMIIGISIGKKNSKAARNKPELLFEKNGCEVYRYYDLKTGYEHFVKCK